MLDDLRFPIGFKFPNGEKYQSVLHEGANWQIVESNVGTRLLVVEAKLVEKWRECNLVGVQTFTEFTFGRYKLEITSSGVSKNLSLVASAESTFNKIDALAFAIALKETRKINRSIPLQDAIYIEKLSRLLPTYSISATVPDDELLGYWLTGGVNVSVLSLRRFRHLVGAKFSTNELVEILQVGGFDVNQEELKKIDKAKKNSPQRIAQGSSGRPIDGNENLFNGRAEKFHLSGRPELTKFFNENVIEIVNNRDKYKALGVEFPSAIVLYGPPGTGKTYAVDHLVNFLGWPSYRIESSSIGSPYIHETGRKIAEIFDLAIENSPSVIVIDEMEAFLASREMNAGHHRVEEVAEFLRRIPEAVQNEVLIISMTNRIEMIDEAILRRGRFDHVLEVGYASLEEVKELLDERLSKIPVEKGVDTKLLAIKLCDRPLSDVDFVLREGARLAVSAEKNCLDHSSLSSAIADLVARTNETEPERKIGF